MLSRLEFVKAAALGLLSLGAVLPLTGCQDEQSDKEPNKSIDVIDKLETKSLTTKNFEISITEAEYHSVSRNLELCGTVKNISAEAQAAVFYIGASPEGELHLIDFGGDWPRHNPILAPQSAAESNWEVTLSDYAYSDSPISLQAKECDPVYRDSTAQIDILFSPVKRFESIRNAGKRVYNVGQHLFVFNRSKSEQSTPNAYVNFINGSDIIESGRILDNPYYAKVIPPEDYEAYYANCQAFENASFTMDKERFNFFEKHGSDYITELGRPDSFSLLTDGIKNKDVENTSVNKTEKPEESTPSTYADLNYEIESKSWKDGKYVVEVNVENKTLYAISEFKITVSCKNYHDKLMAADSIKYTSPYGIPALYGRTLTFEFPESKVPITPDKVIVEISAL